MQRDNRLDSPTTCSVERLNRVEFVVLYCMSTYTQACIDDKVSRFGEAFVVMDSGEQYEIHGSEQYEFTESPAGVVEVRIEGVRDGEKIVTEVPLAAIEHVYTHREI